MTIPCQTGPSDIFRRNYLKYYVVWLARRGIGRQRDAVSDGLAIGSVFPHVLGEGETGQRVLVDRRFTRLRFRGG